jgi:hypothetical protein
VRRAAALLTLIVSSAVLLPAADRLSFELAVLRRDGILVPFAAYNGHDWSAPWPTSDSNVVLPIGLDDVPKKWWGPVDPASKWTALMAADGSRRPVKLERPEQFRAFCGGHIGLRTDYTAGPIDNNEPSVAKDALAVAGGPGEIPVDPIVEVSTYSPDAGRVIGMIIGDFNKEEKKAAMRFTRWVHPYSALERAAMPIHLEALYRFREKTPLHGEWLANYVEAIRRFPASPYDRDCGLITWVRGWVIEREGKAPDIHITATITYCDREGVSFMQPLGHLRIDGENYWVYQTSSWRDEIYTVARMAPEEVRPVLNVFGGGCPKEAAR